MSEVREYTCDVCGKSCEPFEDGDEDFDLDPSWIELEASRLVRNPDYAHQKHEQDALFGEAMSAIVSNGGEDSPAVRSSARATVARQLPIEAPPFVVDTQVLHVCEGCAVMTGDTVVALNRLLQPRRGGSAGGAQGNQGERAPSVAP